jgi:uncharacterized protein (TIGR02391 family)
LREDTNKVLMFAGFEVDQGGKLREVPKAATLDEVDRRVNSLERHFYNRASHPEVTRYCSKDYLRKDYYDAVFEVAKSLAERVRTITGIEELDGGELFQTAFSTKAPYIFFNNMQTKSEISEHNGLKELLESIYHLVKNPAAHTPKIHWKTDEIRALDVLTMISLVHKYLDECNKMPGR